VGSNPTPSANLPRPFRKSTHPNAQSGRCLCAVSLWRRRQCCGGEKGAGGRWFRQRSGKVIIPGHYFGFRHSGLHRGLDGLDGRCSVKGVEFLLRVGIEMFQIRVGVTAVQVVMVRDPFVLDDAVQLQAELYGAERQTAAFLFQRVGDDLLNLARRFIKQGLMIGPASGPELLDPDTDFRLVHKKRAALLGTLRRIAGPAGRFGSAHVAGHGLAERFLPVGQADDGRR
jgi:hypothetical protein